MSWQPIDTAPTDGTVVDLFITYRLAETKDDGTTKMKLTGYRIADCTYDEGEWRMIRRDGTYNRLSHHEKPSHWMPEPKPPHEIDDY